MTNSETHVRAVRLLETLRGYVTEDYLVRHIDEPIDRAAGIFRFPAANPVSHARFHEVLARFVAYVYARGLPGRVRLNRSQAHDETVALIEQFYEGTKARGYEAAVLEARQGQPHGLEVVLDRLTDAIKLRARWIHLRWVFTRFLGPANWELRCELAGLLLDQLRPWLPEHMAACAGEQYADEIPALLVQCLTFDNQFQHACLAGWLSAA